TFLGTLVLYLWVRPPVPATTGDPAAAQQTSSASPSPTRPAPRRTPHRKLAPSATPSGQRTGTPFPPVTTHPPSPPTPPPAHPAAPPPRARDPTRDALAPRASAQPSLSPAAPVPPPAAPGHRPGEAAGHNDETGAVVRAPVLSRQPEGLIHRDCA